MQHTLPTDATIPRYSSAIHRRNNNSLFKEVKEKKEERGIERKGDPLRHQPALVIKEDCTGKTQYEE